MGLVLCCDLSKQLLHQVVILLVFFRQSSARIRLFAKQVLFGLFSGCAAFDSREGSFDNDVCARLAVLVWV